MPILLGSGRCHFFLLTVSLLSSYPPILLAREVMDDWGETGAIRPEHLREAQRRYRKSEVQHGTGVKTASGYKRRLFCR